MKEKIPSVSVIVPVYKAEAYLAKCLDSLLAQTLEDFELLLVDDGSPDRSGKICDEYAAADSRIRVLHKDNGGVSSARQCGIDHARGEYTIHADPDDWVESDMLEHLYRKAKEDEADMVICDYYVNTKGKQRYIKQRPSALDPHIVQRELFQQLHGSCWNKLIRRSCYITHKVKFPVGINLSEDTIFNVRLLNNDIRIAYLPKAYYHYVQNVNPNSLVKNSGIDTYLRLMSIFKAELQNDVYLEILPYLAYGISLQVLRHGICSRQWFKRNYGMLPLIAWRTRHRNILARLALLLWGVI